MDYTSYVNIKQGTWSQPKFSCGNTLPLVAAPYGMNHFCLQTGSDSGSWFYHPTHRQMEGIRLTHQPSPWVGDYGHFVFMAQSGDPCVTPWQRGCYFSEKTMAPDSMELHLPRFGATMKLAPSDRCCIIENTWSTAKTPRFALIPFSFHTELALDAEKGILTGWSNAKAPGTREDFRVYFHLTFDKPVDIENTFVSYPDGKLEKANRGSGMGAGINIAFKLSEGEALTVRMGTSFISAEQAARNVKQEVADLTYDRLRRQTKDKWNDLLSRIQITDSEERKNTFYSCFYRCFLFPRVFHELDETGAPYHYSARDGSVRPGLMYTDNGFWDTCRSLYPLLTLLIPERVKEMLEGYLNFYREEGWLPKWLSPGERGIMPGTLVDAVLADAAVKGLLTREQMEFALEGMLKHANTPSGNRLNGRVGVADYVTLGYIPADKYSESVNNALDAYYCDYCISRIAALLGHTDLQKEYEARSGKYDLLFDKEAGFIRGLNSDGTRKPGFIPHEWAEEYCEGSAWQNAFGVMHDVDGLADLYGGAEALVKVLDALFAAPADFEVGKYKAEIHEMSEMHALGEKGFGQCGMSNQPSFHIPYMYAMLGHPEKTAYWIRRLVTEVFDGSAQGYPGDEDNGSMAAWYVLSVLGFYPVCPGKPEYITGTCCAEEVLLRLANGNTVTIRGTGSSACVDGVSCEHNRICHESLLSAKHIVFQ